MSVTTVYTAFWLYQMQPDWRDTPVAERTSARAEFVDLMESAAPSVRVRGTYSCVGFRPDVDLIVWSASEDVDALQQFAVRINRTPVGHALRMRQAYIGTASASQYDPTHGPAFVKGIPPKRFLSVYPFTKTPEWYLLPFEKRREMMAVHGQLGDEFPSILTNTVSSFGIADQEFIVALEDDDPNVLVKMVQRLRAADVRIYTQVDTPIFLGRLKSPEDVLLDLE